jgi:hypothetical protein
MKKINFEIVFKIIVLIQLTLILLISLFRDSSNNSQVAVEPNEIGRYKEIKTKTVLPDGRGEQEYIRILDTETGKYVNPR